MHVHHRDHRHRLREVFLAPLDLFSYRRRQILERRIQERGGTVVQGRSALEEATHCVVATPAQRFYDCAYHTEHCHVVTEQWLVQFLRTGQRPPESSFLLREEFSDEEDGDKPARAAVKRQRENI